MRNWALLKDLWLDHFNTVRTWKELCLSCTDGRVHNLGGEIGTSRRKLLLLVEPHLIGIPYLWCAGKCLTTGSLQKDLAFSVRQFSWCKYFSYSFCDWFLATNKTSLIGRIGKRNIHTQLLWDGVSGLWHSTVPYPATMFSMLMCPGPASTGHLKPPNSPISSQIEPDLNFVSFSHFVNWIGKT